MELDSYIDPFKRQPQEMFNTSKISFIFTVHEDISSQSFQKLFIRKSKYTRNRIFLLVKINPLQN